MNPSKRNAWGLFNLGAAATIWGSTFVVSRYALASVSFLHLVILRFACSTVLFLVLFLVQRPRLPHGREWWLYLGSAASGYVLSIPFQFLGTSLTSAHIGSIITCATPLAMVVLAGLFLHERIRLRDIAAIIVALAGVALISLEGLRGNSGGSPLQWLGGIAALVAAAVTWGFYSLFLRLITRKQSSLTATGISNGLGFIILLPLFISGGGDYHRHRRQPSRPCRSHRLPRRRLDVPRVHPLDPGTRTGHQRLCLVAHVLLPAPCGDTPRHAGPS